MCAWGGWGWFASPLCPVGHLGPSRGIRLNYYICFGSGVFELAQLRQPIWRTLGWMAATATSLSLLSMGLAIIIFGFTLAQRLGDWRSKSIARSLVLLVILLLLAWIYFFVRLFFNVDLRYSLGSRGLFWTSIVSSALAVILWFAIGRSARISDRIDSDIGPYATSVKPHTQQCCIRCEHEACRFKECARDADGALEAITCYIKSNSRLMADVLYEGAGRSIRTQGCWMDRDFGFVDAVPGKTYQLILVVSHGGKHAALDDKRTPSDKYTDVSIRDLSALGSDVTVTVTPYLEDDPGPPLMIGLSLRKRVMVTRQPK